MTKSAFMRIVLIAESVLIIIGVILMCSMCRPFKTGNVINVYLKDGETEAVEFKDLALIPGDTKEYQIKLIGSPAEQYNVKIVFAEEEEKTLKKFLYVKIIADDIVICDQLLADAFEGNGLILPVDFREGKHTDLTIIYHLPIEVGNEAKNAEAVFSLLFTPINE